MDKTNPEYELKEASNLNYHILSSSSAILNNENYTYSQQTNITDNISPTENSFFGGINSSKSPSFDHYNTPPNDIQSLLRLWKLDFLLDYFIAEQVDIDILRIMKQHHLERLISKQPLGIQVLFEEKLSKWRDDIGLPLYNCNKMHSIEDIWSPQTKISNYSTPTPPHSDPPLPTTETMANNCQITLAQILNESGKGAMITHYYDKIGSLQDYQRNVLVNIICQYFNDKNINMSLKISYQLEKEICERFPTEKPEFYRSGKRGKIYNRCCNIKCSFKPILVDINSKKEEPSNATTLVSEVDATSCLRSLKFDKLSIEEFDRTWAACSNYRLNDIRMMNNTFDILQKWPFYKQPSGFRLIDMDFNVLFPENINMLDNWADYSICIKKFILSDSNIKDKSINTVLLELKQNSKISENSHNAILLWALHGYLVPTQKIVKKNNVGKKSVTKCTIRDSQESFLFVGKTILELDDHIKFLSETENHIQPLILAIGGSVSDIHETYVYFDGVKFSFTNILRAADICFKIFHLFNLEYPLPATNFYTFLQELFYGIKTTKNKSTKINVLLNEILNNSKM